MLRLPERLWIVRHGESAGNVAWAEAEARGHHLIDVSPRDADVPLSPTGEGQARALGEWLGRRPSRIFTSPYLRAAQTAELARQAAGLDVPVQLDERLREKEFGALNRMTRAGILATMPEQAELRAAIGKFYYRPPGGESWADIVLRLRSFWRDLRDDAPDEHVLVVCHSVVTLCLRYVIEGLDEAAVMAIDQASDIANCAVTSYARREGRLVLDAFNQVAPLRAAGETVTRAPDPPRPK
jgi:probable phosphoglycerate mutase